MFSRSRVNLSMSLLVNILLLHLETNVTQSCTKKHVTMIQRKKVESEGQILYLCICKHLVLTLSPGHVYAEKHWQLLPCFYKPPLFHRLGPIQINTQTRNAIRVHLISFGVTHESFWCIHNTASFRFTCTISCGF